MCDRDDNAFNLDGDLGWRRAPCLKDLTGSSFGYDRDGDAFEGDGRLASGLADLISPLFLSPAQSYQVMFGAVSLLQCFEQQQPARR